MCRGVDGRTGFVLCPDHTASRTELVSRTEKPKGWNWQGDGEQVTLVMFVASLEQSPLQPGRGHRMLLHQSGATESLALWDCPPHPASRGRSRGRIPSQTLCPICIAAPDGRESKGNKIGCGEDSEASRVFMSSIF